MKETYGVSITPVDYADAPGEACKTINEWVESQTAEKIKDLIKESDLTPPPALVLVNAIYFKGDWESQFKKDQTRESDFTVPNGGTTKVPLMHQTGDFGYKATGNMQILELPYTGKSLSMVVLLPRAADGLNEIENTLTPGNLRAWLSGLATQRVNVAFPKFRIEWGVKDLKPTLKALGMKTAFIWRQADFSGMDGTMSLFIGAVLHKAFVDVNEAGTEAAAATAVIMPRGMAHFPDFRADHPFLFLIRDNATGSILFLGRVTNPVAK